MSVFQATFSAAGVNAANGVFFNLKAPATIRPRLLEVGIFIEVASTNAPQYGLMRMLAVGTGAITTATQFITDPGEPAGLSTFETAWATTRPTVTGGSAYRTMVPNTIGNGAVWIMQPNRPLYVPVSGGICGVMLNASGATTGTHGGYVIWEE